MHPGKSRGIARDHAVPALRPQSSRGAGARLGRQGERAAGRPGERQLRGYRRYGFACAAPSVAAKLPGRGRECQHRATPRAGHQAHQASCILAQLMFGLPDEFTPAFLGRLEELRIRTRRQFAGMGRGQHLSPKRGSSLEWSDYRPYSAGDDFRYIDWGMYGRTDKFYIKLFKEEEDLLTYVFIDASASMGF